MASPIANSSLRLPLDPPWVKTPCHYSSPLSEAAGCKIYLKLDNLQPSGSFKCRGIGNMVYQAVARARPGTAVHFYCPSGGNAGLACVVSAQRLRCKATIVVPLSTPDIMVAKLRRRGAEVLQVGKNWGEANQYIRQLLAGHDDPESVPVYVSPYDHPDIWAGVATVMDELVEQVPGPIHGIVCNVGGGGLLCGILQTLEKWQDQSPETPLPTVLAIETVGTDSLGASLKAGRVVTLPGVTSIATSLGVLRVLERCFDLVQQAGPRFVYATVTDAEAVAGCVRFLDDTRMLVEVACGATITTAYNGDLRTHLGSGLTDLEWAQKIVVLEVCGGSNINLDLLVQYRTKYGT